MPVKHGPMLLTYVQGLADPHVHLIQGGLSLSQLELADLPSKEAFIKAVGAACSTSMLYRSSHEHGL